MRVFQYGSFKLILIILLLAAGVLYFVRPYFANIYDPGILEEKKWRAGQEVIIVFYGDSIVAGHGLARGFPEIIREKTENHNIIGVKIYNKGVDGYSSADLLRSLPSQIDSLQPDLIFIHVGWNDYRQGRNVDIFKENYRKLLDIIEESAGTAILMTTTRVNVPLSDRAIRKYNKAIRKLAVEYSLPLLDMNAVWKKAGRGNSLPDLLLNDNIHPSREGHQLIAETIWNEFIAYHFF